MGIRSLLAGAATIGALALAAGCGSTTTTTGNAGAGVSTSHGAGGGNPGAGSTSVPDACGLLTQSAMAQISGDATVSKLSGSTQGTLSECIYADTTTSGGGGGGEILIENIPSGFGGTAMAAALQQAISSGQSQAVSVSGLGNTALKEVTSTTAAYAFTKGNFFVIISVESATRTGSDMDSAVGGVATSVAGQL